MKISTRLIAVAIATGAVVLIGSFITRSHRLSSPPLVSNSHASASVTPAEADSLRRAFLLPEPTQLNPIAATYPGSLHHLLATGQAQPDQLLDAIKNYNQVILESPQKFLLNPPLDLLATRVALSRLIEGKATKTASSSLANSSQNRLSLLYKNAPLFTVIIEETNPESGRKGNGSGTIIARSGNTYTLLTTNHVVCRNQSEICNQFRPNLRVITHDEREYSVDLETVKKIPGLDLAIFEITSEQDYQVATLGNYDKFLNRKSAVPIGNRSVVHAYGQVVFASGWPGINPPQITERLYKFNPGILQPAEKISQVRIRPLEEGYEAVYTNITFPGMTGGPILDAEGRVIAIHGQNEGTRIYDATKQRRERVIIGYSLGIPIEKFLGGISQAGVQRNIQVETTHPDPLNEDELERIGTHYLTDLLTIQARLPSLPESPTDWTNEANQMWRLRQPQMALEAYEKATQIDPEFYPAWYGKLLFYTDWNKYEQGFFAAEQAINILNRQIAQFPRETALQDRRDWIMNQREQIQDLLGNLEGGNQIQILKPHPSSELAFFCGNLDQSPTTFGTGKTGVFPVSRWVGNPLNPWGLDPLSRCVRISGRFQQYHRQNQLKHITFKTVNGESVICISDQENGDCTGFLFTLISGINSSQVVKDLSSFTTLDENRLESYINPDDVDQIKPFAVTVPRGSDSSESNRRADDSLWGKTGGDVESGFQK